MGHRRTVVATKTVTVATAIASHTAETEVAVATITTIEGKVDTTTIVANSMVKIVASAIVMVITIVMKEEDISVGHRLTRGLTWTRSTRNQTTGCIIKTIPSSSSR